MDSDLQFVTPQPQKGALRIFEDYKLQNLFNPIKMD